MEIKIGKSLKAKTAGEALAILKDRYLGENYSKLVSEKKAEKVTESDIKACIAKNWKKDEGAEKLNADSDGKSSTIEPKTSTLKKSK